MAMIEDIVASVFRENLTAVSWAIEEVALLALYDWSGKTLCQFLAVPAEELSCQLTASSNL